jgi:hypothetical protein
MTPSAILRRLSSYNSHNRLYHAFRELGHALRTEFLLLYLADAPVRTMIQAATNKRESCNRLVQWLAFGGEQIIATNDRAAQRKIMKYTHVVANGTIVYNVVMISQVLQALHAEGQTIDPDASAAVSPSITAHIDRFGRYSLDEDQHPPPLDESIVRTAWVPDTRRDAAVATSKGSSNQDQEAGPVQ